MDSPRLPDENADDNKIESAENHSTPPPAAEDSLASKFGFFILSFILTIIADTVLVLFFAGVVGLVFIFIAILLLNAYIALNQVRIGQRYAAYGIVAALCFFLLAAGGCIMMLREF